MGDKIKKLWGATEKIAHTHWIFTSLGGGAMMTSASQLIYGTPLPVSISFGAVIFGVIALVLKLVPMIEAEQRLKQARVEYYESRDLVLVQARLELIKRVRRMIGSHHSMDHGNFDIWVTSQPEFFEIRAHLSNDLLDMLGDRNSIFWNPSGSGGMHDGKMKKFADEVDALAREWKVD